MVEARFGSDGVNRTTFAPVELVDMRESQWKEVRLLFNAWKLLRALSQGDSIDGYYLNGYGIQGLVRACCANAGLDQDGPGIVYDSEAGACFIHFASLDEAVRTAQLTSEMLRDRNRIATMIQVARELGIED